MLIVSIVQMSCLIHIIYQQFDLTFPNVEVWSNYSVAKLAIYVYTNDVLRVPDYPVSMVLSLTLCKDKFC